jgi:hypothetical protein
MSAAAALRTGGMTVSVVGVQMSFPERMPPGMLVRSPYVVSSIGDPGGPLSPNAFEASTATVVSRPVPLERLLEHGRGMRASCTTPNAIVRRRSSWRRVPLPKASCAGLRTAGPSLR